jgi:hypothetical protein
VFDRSVARTVAEAVARAAQTAGLARIEAQPVVAAFP